MELNYNGLKNTSAWQAANVELPTYDIAATCSRTKNDPMWVHIGIGNIFRVFIGGIADNLLRQGLMNRGITCVECYDYELVDKIYNPHNNLVLSVILNADGTTSRRVLASLTEAVKASTKQADEWKRLKTIFSNPGLQMVSFTITEKGYAIHNTSGNIISSALNDMQNGPEHVTSAMGIVTSMLYTRYSAGALPLSLVSMDNVSRNGEKLRASVLEMAKSWLNRGFVDKNFVDYVEDESVVAFPWTMIDKITPRPSQRIAKDLAEDGLEGMEPIVTSRQTYIAPFANTEKPQYLVIEDKFPNGRPPLEKAGVYMTDRTTVNLAERMKVTACLNPIHTALGPYAVMLGYELFADGMSDPELRRLAHRVGYLEGLPMVKNPGIISPKKFLDEVINERFPNVYLGDTSQRICTDVSMGVAFRFGETIKAHMAKYGTAEHLIGIPLAIAGWLRYLLGFDDKLVAYDLAPDPMKDEICKQLSGISPSNPSSLTDQLCPIMENSRIWGVDLYKAGLANKIEDMFRRQLHGCGAVRDTLKLYLD